MMSEFAVLWDLDGTIIDSAPYHDRAWQATFAAEGIPFDAADFRRTFGWRNDRILFDIAGPNLLPERVAAIALAKEERYREIVRREGIAPLPGVQEWLERLHAQGIPQAIVSSAPCENITVVVAALGAAGLFQTLISGDDVAQGKPDPASFLLAAHRLGMPPSACVVVEDAPAGVEAARRAGMACLAVTTSHPRADLAADLVVESLAGLPEDAFERLVRPQTLSRR
jgi:beta-phosphoglucomutase family hydrolase